MSDGLATPFTPKGGLTVDFAALLLLGRERGYLTPDDLMAAMFKDEQRTEELRSMGERVRLLSATIDALLGQMDEGGGKPGGSGVSPERSAEPAPPAKAAPARKRTGQARTSRG